jgi:hypothetical protein
MPGDNSVGVVPEAQVVGMFLRTNKFFPARAPKRQPVYLVPA